MSCCVVIRQGFSINKEEAVALYNKVLSESISFPADDDAEAFDVFIDRLTGVDYFGLKLWENSTRIKNGFILGFELACEELQKYEQDGFSFDLDSIKSETAFAESLEKLGWKPEVKSKLFVQYYN